jgi:uncharacterized membrane protein
MNQFTGFLKSRKIWLLLIVVLGLTLRLDNLASRSLWTDEFFTLFLSSGHGREIQSFSNALSQKTSPQIIKMPLVKRFLHFDRQKTVGDVVRGVLFSDTHPPLYYCIMHYWMRAFGDSAFALRMFSILLGVIAIILAYSLGKSLFDEKAGITSALFLSISPYAVRYAQEARSYSLLLAIGLLTGLLLLRLEKYARTRDAFGLAVFSAVGIYAHYFYLLVILSQFGYIIVSQRKNKAVLDRYLLSFLLTFLFLIPWFLILSVVGYNFHLAEWVFGFPGILNKLYPIPEGVLQYILIGENLNAPTVFVSLLGVILFIGVIIWASLKMYREHAKQLFFSSLGFFVPLAVLFLIDVVQKGFLLRQERFWMFSYLGFVPVGGYLLKYFLMHRRWIFYLSCSLMIISSFYVPHVQFGPAPLAVSRWINQRAAGKNVAVIVTNMRSLIGAQAYYLEDNIDYIPLSVQGGGFSIDVQRYDKVFLVRHFHPTNFSLMDRISNLYETGVFKKTGCFERDFVSACEYTVLR